MLDQPLSGEYAGRRTVLERVPFFTGYAVEVGLLIDIERRFGMPSIAQVDMDVRVHRNQSLESLRRMSSGILAVLISRSEEVGKLALLEGMRHEMHLIHREGATYLHDKEEVRGAERPPMITVRAYRGRRGIPEDDLAALEGPGKPSAVSVVPYLREELVLLDMEAHMRDEALAELVHLLAAVVPGVSRETLLTRLRDREQQMSTAFGHGVAVPHAVVDELSSPVIVVGRSARGVVFFASPFRRPVHLVFLIAAPESQRERYLEVLSSLARLLHHRGVIPALTKSTSPSELISLIKKHEAPIRLKKELGL